MFKFTIPNWGKKESYEAVQHYDRVDWVQKGKRGMKRIRAMTLCCIFYEMEVGVDYPTQTICEMLIDKDAKSGHNSMNLSRQRLGYFMSLYSRWGILEKNIIGGYAHYRRLY